MFLGDFLGSPDMNEKNMMKEIRARGPVGVGIMLPLNIAYYKKGVMTCKTEYLPSDLLPESERDILRRIRDEFRPIEHLVTVVGWGETEAGEKYWIVQNSYSFEIWHESSTIN